MNTLQIALITITLGLTACGDNNSPATSAGTAQPADTAVEPVVEVGTGAVAGLDNSAAGQAAEAPASAASSADLAAGKVVFSKHCITCHGAGIAGAPRLTDKADWASRATQGIETLNTHAIKGFQGSKGYMPPKGGFASLADSDVIAAVAYMLSESR